MFTCQYSFDKNAYCDASFRLRTRQHDDGRGRVQLQRDQFTLDVTGGYGELANRTGFVEETPSARHAQKLSFELE